MTNFLFGFGSTTFGGAGSAMKNIWGNPPSRLPWNIKNCADLEYSN
jgi:hypothetical protein